MNKQKLISALQSRIAKRRNLLEDGWELFDDLQRDEDTEYDAYYFVVSLIKTGYEQKVDKQLLRQLILDERELKEWKARFDTSSKALGIIASMREK